MRGLLFALPAPSQAVDTLARIAGTHHIVIGYRRSGPPFSFFSGGHVMAMPSTSASGWSMTWPGSSSWAASTSNTRRSTRRRASSWSTTAASTWNAPRPPIPPRAASWPNFYPYFFTTTNFVSKKSAGLHTIADLAGHTVAATSGTSDLDDLNKTNKARNLHILVMLRRTHGEAFGMVESGQASAFVMDHSILSGLVADSDHPEDYVISQDTFSDPEPYGIAMPLGDTAFKNAVDQALGKLFASHEIDAIYDKWFMRPIPPQGRNLNMPMTAILRDWITSPREYLH